MAARHALPVVLLVVVAACGADTAGPAVVIEPGVTAMQQADVLACDADRGVVQQAVDTYTMLEGAPPPDEAALVPQYLRETSELHDLTHDGAVVAAAASPC